MGKSNLVSPEDYAEIVEAVYQMKAELFRLAEQKGNLDPEVIALSQHIDQYIVLIQKYWKHQNPQVS